MYTQPEPLLALGKRGHDEPADHALERSRGGLTTKTYALRRQRDAVTLPFSGGQASDINYAQPLLDEVSSPSCLDMTDAQRQAWLRLSKA